MEGMEITRLRQRRVYATHLERWSPQSGVLEAMTQMLSAAVSRFPVAAARDCTHPRLPRLRLPVRPRRGRPRRR